MVYYIIYKAKRELEYGKAKRGLEYGVRAPVFCGNLREKTVSTNTYRKKLVVFLQKSPKISGNLREFT